ncbi:hypothetical protein J5N97_009268 [Dioscorea zingiberensis]|uniref:MYB transcription factor n=1 Tax=Dioscorea zingiberensis TaxID=325984 RepID=A0A9D5CX87_9LILI|nr:hypothetical protein J5N97_009268 [Dioscorea zingiberensis]
MGDLESSKAAMVVSDRLTAAGKEGEEEEEVVVVMDPRAEDDVKKKEALDAFKCYLEERSARLGPTNLQFVVKALKTNELENLDELKEKLIRRDPQITERLRSFVKSSSSEFEKFSSQPIPTLKKDTNIVAESSSSEPEKLLKKPLPKLGPPLNIEPIRAICGRRKKRRWSTLEEDTLREAVKSYGKGNWKLIKMSYPEIFEERTEVDLKDKWRNMTRW